MKHLKSADLQRLKTQLHSLSPDSAEYLLNNLFTTYYLNDDAYRTLSNYLTKEIISTSPGLDASLFLITSDVFDKELYYAAENPSIRLFTNKDLVSYLKLDINKILNKNISINYDDAYTILASGVISDPETISKFMSKVRPIYMEKLAKSDVASKFLPLLKYEEIAKIRKLDYDKIIALFTNRTEIKIPFEQFVSILMYNIPIEAIKKIDLNICNLLEICTGGLSYDNLDEIVKALRAFNIFYPKTCLSILAFLRAKGIEIDLSDSNKNEEKEEAVEEYDDEQYTW